MIKFWYFVIQNLDKACYINFLIGTLVQSWVACLHYLLISSKHSQDSGRKRLQIVKWLHKISLNYADDKQVFVHDWNEIASRFHSWYWATNTSSAHLHCLDNFSLFYLHFHFHTSHSYGLGAVWYRSIFRCNCQGMRTPRECVWVREPNWRDFIPEEIKIFHL